MASAQRNVDFILEQMSDAGVSARKMFGEYAIYCRGKVVALFCDDQLFLKPTAQGRAFIGKVTEAPPYPGAKPCFLISGDRCEDGEWLAELVRLTERELPTPKAKTKAKTSPKSAKPKAVTGRAQATRSQPTKAKAKAKAKAKPKPKPKPKARTKAPSRRA